MGRGSRFYEERLVKLAKRLGVEHKVKFLGYVSEDEKISLLDSSKILVLPTRHFGEAYPLIIDEAYARGVPVIATRIGALPYRVRHMETGLLIPPVDPLSLAKSIVVLTKNRGLFTRIRENLLRVRESILTWRHVCEKLDKIYGAKN
jgi:glycosyltransferase involved in cell wall biosynthesis